MQPDEPERSPAAEIALAFARALVAGDYVSAHRMLAASQRDDLQPAELKAEYEAMTSYWTTPATEIRLVGDVGANWPDKDENYVAWPYVSIECRVPGNGVYLEAIAARVVRERGRHLIAEVVWGRP